MPCHPHQREGEASYLTVHTFSRVSWLAMVTWMRCKPCSSTIRALWNICVADQAQRYVTRRVQALL